MKPRESLRRAARVAVIAPGPLVLMVRMRNVPGSFHRVFWTLPGGRCEHGERFDEAASRELYEETGLVLALSGPVAERRAVYEVEGPFTHSHEVFFRAETDREVNVFPAAPDEGEADMLSEFGWFDSAALGRLREPFFPPCLALAFDALQAWQPGTPAMDWS